MRRSILLTATFLTVLPLLASAATCPSLSRGATGSSVTQLQQFLSSQYQNFPTATGYYGAITEAAVQQWQREHGIEARGIVGPKTAAAMKLNLCITPSTNSTQALIDSLLIQLHALQAQLATLLAQQNPQTTSVPTVTTTPVTTVTTGGGGGGGGSAPTPTPTPPSPNPPTPPPASCTWNGQNVASGANVTAYQTSSVPYGSQCVSEQRACSNGVLLGSYANATCSVSAPASCTVNGTTVVSGASQTFYSAQSVPPGSLCSSISQSRTCSNGVLSGTYSYSSCTVNQPSSCSFNGQTVANGANITAYQSPTVSYGSLCSSVAQTRTCQNGVLSGTYTYAACTVNAPASCTFNGATVASGQSITAYQASSVPSGQQCVSQSRLCTNGVLSGTYTYASCSVQSAPPTATFTINGSTNVTANVGDTLHYAWSSTNGASAKTTYTVDGVGPYDGGVNTLSGTLSQTIAPPGGDTTVFTYTVTDSQGRKASATASVSVPVTNTGYPTMSPLNLASNDGYIQMAASGPAEIVVQHTTDACNDDDIPDEPAHAFRNADGTVSLIDSHYVTRREVGTTLDTAKHQCPIIMNSTGNINFSAVAYHEWLISPYRVGSTIYGLIHNEWYGNIVEPSRCPDLINGWVSGITTVSSSNGGATFAHPSDYIVRPPFTPWSNTFPCSASNPTIYGSFNPSNIVSKGGYYYSIFTSHKDPTGVGTEGQCIMRTQDLSGASSWMVWTGSGWQSARTTTNCAALPGLADKAVMSVTYNSYLGAYLASVIFGNTGVGYAVSTDLLHWSMPVQFLGTQISQATLAYGSFLDSTDTSTNFENTGRDPYFYITLWHSGGTGLNRDLIRQKVHITSLGGVLPPILTSQTPYGAFDSASGGLLSGWALDQDVSSQSINVALYMDGAKGAGGQLIATIPTSILRPDVNSGLGVSGNHGFSWTIPAQYASASHSWYVYGVDSADPNILALLSGAPKTSTVVASGPTATFTINGKTSLTAKVGDTMTYVWSSTNGATANTTYTDNGVSMGGFGVKTFSGSMSEPVTADWTGHTYVVTYTVTDTQGKTASAQATVKVNTASTSNNLGDLWFTPNTFASADVKQLFYNPSSWATARGQVSVYGIFDQAVNPSPYNTLSDADLTTLIGQLKSWNVGFSLETGAVKPWGCTADITSNVSLNALDRITRLGGSMQYLMMDEPLIGGSPAQGPCNLDMNGIAQQTAAYMADIHKYYPDIRIGEAEPWPFFSKQTLEQWLSTLVAASPAYKPAYFILDVDSYQAKLAGAPLSDIQDIASYSRSLGIPFRIFIWNSDFTVPAVLVTNDATEYAATMQFAAAVHAAVASFDGVNLESWDLIPLTTTPDSTPNTFTNLLRDYAAKYPPAMRTYPFASRALPRNQPPTGTFDQVSSTGLASGWAYDQDATSQSINVQLYLDAPKGQQQPFATVPANVSRPDVNSAKGITGNHGFAWQVPAQYISGNHQWYAYAVDSSDSSSVIALQNSPRFIIPSLKPPVGNFDTVDALGNLDGWSYDPDSPGDSNNVAIYMDGAKGQGGQLMATIPTTAPRPDVNTAFGIGGMHGFSWAIPSQYKGTTHSWYVYGVDLTDPTSLVLLSGSPQQSH